jgi:hypothetical protein
MKDSADIRKAYADAQKAHALPDYAQMDAEFEISAIDSEKFLLRKISDAMMDKANESITFLSDVLQPDTNLTSLYESRVFDDAEKKIAYDAFKKLMMWKRSSFEVYIAGDDASHAAFVSGFFTDWKTLKPLVLAAVEKIKQSWELEAEQAEKLGYFG